MWLVSSSTRPRSGTDPAKRSAPTEPISLVGDRASSLRCIDAKLVERMIWPWTTPEDRLTCEAVAGSLEDIEARAVVLHALVRQHEPSEGERSTPPWSSWSLRLASQLRVPEPERLALAVILLIESGPAEPARLAHAIAGLEQQGLARAAVALLLLEAGLLAPPASLRPNDHALESDATPARLAQLFGLCAIAASLDPQPFVRFAAATAELLAMFQGLLDLVDDTVHTNGPPPRVAALLRACRADPSASDSLLDACAGAQDHLDRALALRCAATNPAVLQLLAVSRERLVACARAALPSVGTEPCEAFLAALLEGFSELSGALWMRGVMARAIPAPSLPAASAQVSVNAAVDYLAQTRPWASAWDVHRFHPMGAPCVLVGRWFIEGMILLALAEVGRDDLCAEITALLERVPQANARYFPEWSGLPPDADSLGLLLQLASWLPSPPRARLDSWIAVLDASSGSDGIVPTWFPQGPNGRLTPLPGPFLGDACTAVTLAFLLGALRHDGERFASLFRPNLQAILERGCEAGCLHYTRDFATHLLLRLIYALGRHAAPSLAALPSELGLDRLAAARCTALVAAQRVDGGWGSPQATALALESLTQWDPASPSIARAVTYLIHTQGPDGAWPAEPLYITPGKFGGMVPFSAKELTTSLCVRALHLATRPAELPKAALSGSNEPDSTV
jgi:hypothetical protein